MSENDFLIGAVGVASIGGAFDLRTSRIPNWLTYSAGLLGLFTRLVLLGWTGLKSGAAAMACAGLIFLLLFMIGAMGGGDVKLIASVSAWAGSNQVVAILITAALAGGVLAIAYIVCARGTRQTLGNLLDLVRFRLTSGLSPHPTLNVREAGTLRVPFGVAIAMGTLFCAGNALWWR